MKKTEAEILLRDIYFALKAHTNKQLPRVKWFQIKNDFFKACESMKGLINEDHNKC